MKKLLTFFLSFIFCFTAFGQETDDDQSDFGVPNQENQLSKEDSECALSKDSELIKLLNFKLKKFNPTSKEFESGPPLTEEEIKHKSIRFYSLQLKDEKNVKIDIDKFASLGGATLASLLNRSSKVFLRHPEKCEFFSLFGDSIIGHYEISFERILRLYATAVNKDNNIAQEFIRTQIIPSPMSLDSAIKSLYDDYGYQQNIIESLLPQEVRTLFLVKTRW